MFKFKYNHAVSYHSRHLCKYSIVKQTAEHGLLASNMSASTVQLVKVIVICQRLL